MKNLTASEVVHGHSGVSDPLRELIDVFVPTVELNIPDGQTFLAEHPSTILESGNINKVPSIIGLNSEEGLLNSAVIARNESLIQYLREDMAKFLPRLLYFEDDTNRTVLNQLREYYDLPDPKIESLDDFKNWTSLFTDRFWLTDIHRTLTLQAKLSPIFVYYFTYPTQFTFTEIVMALKGEYHPLVEIMGMTVKNLVRKYILGETLPSFGKWPRDSFTSGWYFKAKLYFCSQLNKVEILIFKYFFHCRHLPL